MTEAAVFRLAWQPGLSGGRIDWPGHPHGVGADAAGWTEPETRAAGGASEILWSGQGWGPMPDPQNIRAIITADTLDVSVPAIWRAGLYLGWRGDRLLISSDLRTIADALGATHPSIPGVAAYLAGGRWGPGLSPSLYEGIQALRPGFTLAVRGRERIICVRSWRPEADEDHNSLPIDVAASRLRERLELVTDAILERHDRVGCLFSGGLDSTLVAALLMRRAPHRTMLFNLGSGFGTDREERLRASFLHRFDSVSHAVELPDEARLLGSLRAINAVAPLPMASTFAHVFEAIIKVAGDRGCDAITTGDGGDEVFCEREEILVDLIGRRRAMRQAAAHFTLRGGEKLSGPLRRARRLHADLMGGTASLRADAEEILFAGPDLAEAATQAAREIHEFVRTLWGEGWTLSGIGSWRRAANVPECEPISAAAPHFPVLSPLADRGALDIALRLDRADMVPSGPGYRSKRLLRIAALADLPVEVAMHPKIGSADGSLLRRMLDREHGDLLDLLGSDMARRVGFRLPACAEDLRSSLWQGDAWQKAAALVAWFDRSGRPAAKQTVPTVTATRASLAPALPRAFGATARPTVHVALLATLNVVAQCLPVQVSGRHRRGQVVRAPSEADSIRESVTDLARRACRLPFVSAAPCAMHRALAWYLRLTGQPAVLVEGTQQARTERHFWIELGGDIIDVNGSELPLVEVQPSGPG